MMPTVLLRSCGEVGTRQAALGRWDAKSVSPIARYGPKHGVYALIWARFSTAACRRSCGDRSTAAGAVFRARASSPRSAFCLPAAAPSAQNAARSPALLSSCIARAAFGLPICAIYLSWVEILRQPIRSRPTGVHGALLIWPRHPFAPAMAKWQRTLAGFEIDPNCGVLVRSTWDQPSRARLRRLSALRHLVGLLANDPVDPPLSRLVRSSAR